MARFYQKTFLVAVTKMDVILEIPFFTFSNLDIWFTEEGLTWKTYITAKALPTIKKIELIDKKDLVAAVLNNGARNFVVNVAVFISSDIEPEISIHSFCPSQIASLLADKTST